MIHHNYDETDKRIENLKWTTKRENELHQFSHTDWALILKKRSNNIRKLNVGR